MTANPELPRDDDDLVLRRYLLGGLSAEERERIERAYLRDETFFARMAGAEDDLIDDYARGALTADERAQFEQRFLTTDRARRRVDFARMLARPRRRRSRAVWMAVAAAVLIAALTAGWATLIRRFAPPSPARRQRVVAAQVVSIRLRGDATRGGGEAARLVLAPASDAVRIELEVPAELRGAASEAVVETADGRAVARQLVAFDPAGNAIITIPARLLGAGDYVVLLNGRQQLLRGYSLVVVAKP